MEISRQSYAIDLFTAARKIEGTFQPIGNLWDDLNNADRGYVHLTDATILPMAPGSPLRPVSLPEVTVSKADLSFISFRDESALEEFRLLQRTERFIVYMSAFALRGDFHLGMEQRVPDMLDDMRGRFQPLTDATVFPLIETQVAVPREQKLLLLNLDAVQLYHPQVAP